MDWKIASGWLVAEDVGWSPEPGGCSFINQVGTVNENTDISLPTLSMITLCCFSVSEQQDAVDVRARRPRCVLYFSGRANIISTQT